MIQYIEEFFEKYMSGKSLYINNAKTSLTEQVISGKIKSWNKILIKNQTFICRHTPPTVSASITPLSPNTFNVCDFGADPTGTSDSTEYIQNAINAAGQSIAHNGIGATVLFPAGTFLISSALIIDCSSSKN